MISSFQANCLTKHNVGLFCFFTAPLSPHPPWCLFCSGAREYVWDSETAFPPPPNRTLTGPFEDDERGEEGEVTERSNMYLLFPCSADKA